MEIRNLMTFLKVAELKSFTQAGNEIGYVQSTITSQIQQLEEEIGGKLFERIGKKIVITKIGEELLHYALQIVALSEEARSLTKSDGNIKETLRIGVIHSLYISRLFHIIPLFKEKFPKVTLSITLGTGAELIEDLRKNKLDIIFIIGEELIEDNIINIFYKSEEMVFIACSKNPICNKKNLKLEDIFSQPLVLSEQQSRYYKHLKKIVAKKDLSFNPSIEINNTRAVIELIELGFGISFLPKYAIEDFIESGKFSILPVKETSNIKLYSQMFYHKDKWLSRSMKGFIEISKNYFKNKYE